MKIRILAVVSESHAHVLPQGCSNLPIKSVEKDVKTSIRYIPYLEVFQGVEWRIEEILIDPETLGISPSNKNAFYICMQNQLERFRNKGYIAI